MKALDRTDGNYSRTAKMSDADVRLVRELAARFPNKIETIAALVGVTTAYAQRIVQNKARPEV